MIIVYFTQNSYLCLLIIFKAISMNLLNFVSQFPDEESCKIKWKEFRDQQGVVCPKCGHTHHYWKSDKEMLRMQKLQISPKPA